MSNHFQQQKNPILQKKKKKKKKLVIKLVVETNFTVIIPAVYFKTMCECLFTTTHQLYKLFFSTQYLPSRIKIFLSDSFVLEIRFAIERELQASTSLTAHAKDFCENHSQTNNWLYDRKTSQLIQQFFKKTHETQYFSIIMLEKMEKLN